MVEVNAAGASDQIIASGSAQIAGGVVVVPDDTNFSAPITYTIISSGTGVTGTFSSLTSTVPAIMSLIYNPFSVQLVYLPLNNISLEGNALGVANCFLKLTGADAATVNNALLALSEDEIQMAFEQMTPAQLSAPTHVQLLDAILIRSIYSKHLQERRYNNEKEFNTVWVDFIRQSQLQKNSESNVGYHDTTDGATIGVDYRIDNFVLGSAFSYTQDSLHWQQSAGKASLNSYYGGFYGLWNHDAFYLNVALLGAYNHYKTVRHLNFGTIDRNAHSTHSGNEWLANLGAGYQIAIFSMQWTPYLNLDYVQLHENRYSESGAKSLDLAGNQKNATLLQGDIGIQLSTTQDVYGGVFVPTLTLAYINQTPFSSKNYHANFKHVTCATGDCGCDFNGAGWRYKRNLFAPSLSLTYQTFSGLLNASINYDIKIGNSYWAHDAGFNLFLLF